MKYRLTNRFKFALATGLFAASVGLQAQTPPAMPVKIQVIEKTNVPLTFDYPARVQSANQVEIHARVSGVLLKQHYQDGAEVKAGEVLYTIDPQSYQATVDRAKAQVLMEQARLRQAEREKKRVEGLYRQKAVSEQERDQAISAYELAEAGLVGAQAALKEAQLNLDYTQVTAPISGLTSQRLQTVGNLVGRDYGRTHLTNITQLDTVELHFSVGEKEFIERSQQFEQGILRYTNQNKPTVSVSHLGQTLQGELDFSGHEVEASTGSIKLRARFANANKVLLPGAFVRAEVGGIEAVDAIQIPQKAVLQIGSQAFVYVIQDSKAQLVPIQLQRQVDNSWLVSAGLNVGDQLIINNLIKLRPGTPVQVLPEQPPANQAPTKSAQ